MFYNYSNKLKILTIIYVLLSYSCQKDNGNGSILVTVNYNGNGVEQASVYVERGNDSTSKVPPPHFDFQKGADAIGQAYFENLPPDNYSIFAKGYDINANQHLTGNGLVTVKSRYRENEYDITLNVK